MKEAYHIADILLTGIRNVLRFLGFSPLWVNRLDNAIYFLLILILAWLVGVVTYRALLALTKHFLRFRENATLRSLLEYDVLKKASLVLPPIVLILLLPFAFHYNLRLASLLMKLVTVYLIVTVMVSVNRILSSLSKSAQQNKSMNNHPMKSLFQLAQLLVVLLGIISVIAFITRRSPLNLITGLGAFVAVLILVFRDTLLGFVAGVMLAKNKMLSVGDWIEKPGTPVNGVVVDITLTIVKVQNFDNTIVTIPPYTLVTEPFINWQAMKKSGTRRIECSFLIKPTEIVPCTPDFLERMRAFDADLADFIGMRPRGAEEKADGTTVLIHGNADTNAGLLRAYLELYLRRHPRIDNTQMIMARTLISTREGLPMQLYCFCNDTSWQSYETVRAEISEHFAAILPAFGFHIYQPPGADDYRAHFSTTGK